MYILVILVILIKHLLSLVIVLKYFQKIQSSLEVDKLLYLAMALLNSLLEKSIYTKDNFNEISFKILEWFWAELNIW